MDLHETAGSGPKPPIGLASKHIVLDCRWLGYSGIGRTTESLIDSLRLDPPPGRWTLLVQERLVPNPWPAVEQIVVKRFPGSLRRELTAKLPHSDLIVFPQMIRPLVARRAVQFVHDLIPVDTSPPGLRRFARSAYMAILLYDSTSVLNVDPTVPDRLVAAYRIDRSKILPVTHPIDAQHASIIRGRRDREPSDGSLLFVGRFAPHKNLEAFARAFADSSWDGPFVLIGTPEQKIARSIEKTARDRSCDIRIVGHVDDVELASAYVHAKALVMPSLFEGFGLPIQEATAAGIPVICSRTIPAAVLLSDQRATFDPRSHSEMIAAINHVRAARVGDRVAIQHEVEKRTLANLRKELLAAVTQATERPRGFTRFRRHAGVGR